MSTFSLPNWFSGALERLMTYLRVRNSHFTEVWERHATESVAITIVVALAVAWIYRKNMSAFLRSGNWAFFILAAAFSPHMIEWAIKSAPLLATQVVPTLFFLVAGAGVLSKAGAFWRPTRVFISFHHTLEADASALDDALAKSGLSGLRLPFDPNAEHNELVASVQRHLRRCDAVVCLPGPVPSFVESEVLAASTLGKAIVFVVNSNSSRLPNTALYGYPAFDLQALQTREYRPLISLLRLTHGSWREWRALLGYTPGATLREHSHSWATIALALSYWLIGCTAGVLLVARASDWHEAWMFLRGYPIDLFRLLSLWGLVFVIIWSTVLARGLAFLYGINGLRLAITQREHTGSKRGFALLRASLGRTPAGQELLASMLEGSPLAHHAAHT
jgi:hypothetical protein